MKKPVIFHIPVCPFSQRVEILLDLKGLEFKRAFTLSSIAVDFRVTQVVDGTQGIHSMIPKKIFTTEKKPFWSTAK